MLLKKPLMKQFLFKFTATLTITVDDSPREFHAAN